MNLTIRHGKRRFPRAAIHSSVAVKIGDESYPATARQISEGGLRVETERELPIKQMLVRFELPGFGEQQVVSEICWQRTAPRGYGLRFKDLPLVTQMKIASYVSRMKQAYAELQLALALGKPRPLFASLLRELKLEHLTDEIQLRTTVDREMQQLRLPPP